MKNLFSYSILFVSNSAHIHDKILTREVGWDYEMGLTYHILLAQRFLSRPSNKP